MKNAITCWASAALLLASASVFAHGPAGKPKFGGVVAVVNDTDYEFVARPERIAIYVESHGKKVDTTGAAARVTLLSGGEKSSVTLAPAGDNMLAVKGAFKVGAGTKAVAVVTLAGKPAATARFELK